jgi:hypothetical protein
MTYQLVSINRRQTASTLRFLVLGTVLTGLLVAGVCSASPDPRYCAEHPNVGICSGSPGPGPGQPGYCGAHTEGLDCWSVTGPPKPGEAVFINDVRGHVPGSDTDLLRIARAVCEMLINGASTNYLVPHMAQHLGITNDAADQVMDAAMADACPGLTIDARGVARF